MKKIFGAALLVAGIISLAVPFAPGILFILLALEMLGLRRALVAKIKTLRPKRPA